MVTPELRFTPSAIVDDLHPSEQLSSSRFTKRLFWSLFYVLLASVHFKSVFQASLLSFFKLVSVVLRAVELRKQALHSSLLSHRQSPSRQSSPLSLVKMRSSFLPLVLAGGVLILVRLPLVAAHAGIVQVSGANGIIGYVYGIVRFPTSSGKESTKLTTSGRRTPLESSLVGWASLETWVLPHHPAQVALSAQLIPGRR